MGRIFGIIPITGLEIDQNPLRIYTVDDFSDIEFGGISYLSCLPEIYGYDLSQFLKCKELSNTLGKLRSKEVEECPLLIFEIKDYDTLSLTSRDDSNWITVILNSIATSFCISLWLQKKSSIYYKSIILCQDSYWSHQETDMCFYMPEGTCVTTLFSDIELFQACVTAKTVRNYMKTTDPRYAREGLLNLLKEKMGVAYEKNGMIIPYSSISPESGPSYYLAIRYLQKFLKSKSLAERFKNACTIMEVLYATNDKAIKKKLAQRSAAILVIDNEAASEVITTIEQVYLIRSESGHGNGFTIDEQTLLLADKLDNYIRKIMSYMLSHPQLNYGGNPLDTSQRCLEKEEVSDYFSTMVQSMEQTFRGDPID